MNKTLKKINASSATRAFLQDTSTRLLVFALLFATRSRADEHHHTLNSQENLGQVSFSTSCSPTVQKAVERGVALVHSFWYDAAGMQFKEIAEKDPGCAIAYWGQAMALYHPGWGPPSKEELTDGLKLLQEAEAVHAKSPREEGYIETLMAFYRDHDKLDNAKRNSAYSEASRQLHENFPLDQEATVFYAASILNSRPPDDPNLATTKKAVAILQQVLEENPNHPGAAHYLIHACDNPALAQLGLRAAQRYAQIAPAAPHALHMPSHIFARLGLWDEDIKSNLASLAAARQPAATHIGAEHQIHALHFLEYAYLQTGEYTKAREMRDQLSAIRGEDVSKGIGDYFGLAQAILPSLYLLETQDWNGALALVPRTESEPSSQAITYWARAVAAGHLRDSSAARSSVDQYHCMVGAVKKSEKAFIAQYMEPNGNEARAWLFFAEGKNDEAIRLMRSVADKQDGEGKGEAELPAREMLADMLLETGQPKEALAEYESSMKVDPNRFHALYGAKQAAEAAGEKAKARTYSSRLPSVK
jgi:hypothetical protein